MASKRSREGGMKDISNIELQTWKGETLRLQSFKNKKVWLAFFRYAACPLCNLRVHEMIQQHSSLKRKGVEILAVFQSDAKTIARYVGKQNPPFPLIADPEEKLYERFGLKKGLWAFLHPANFLLLLKAIRLGFRGMSPEGTITRIPGDFLIAPGLKITREFHGKKIGDHIPWEEIEHFAEIR